MLPTPIDTAVIMAAGLGTRFGSATELMPKGFIAVGGKPMVVRSIEALLRCGIRHILIGTGYRSEQYEALHNTYPQIECCYSERYAETNSMYTLYNMRTLVGDRDFLLLESDLVYEDRAITALLSDSHPTTMLITPVTKFQDQYYVERDANNRLVACSTDSQTLHPSGELVGIHKLSASFYRLMCNDYAARVANEPKLGYEFQILSMSKQQQVYVLREEGLKWYEIDDVQDKAYAEQHIIPYIDKQ